MGRIFKTDKNIIVSIVTALTVTGSGKTKQPALRFCNVGSFYPLWQQKAAKDTSGACSKGEMAAVSLSRFCMVNLC